MKGKQIGYGQQLGGRYFTDGANQSTKAFCFQVPCHLTGVDGPVDSTVCKLVTIPGEVHGSDLHCLKGEEHSVEGVGGHQGAGQLCTGRCPLHLIRTQSSL